MNVGSPRVLACMNNVTEAAKTILISNAVLVVIIEAESKVSCELVWTIEKITAWAGWRVMTAGALVL